MFVGGTAGLAMIDLYKKIKEADAAGDAAQKKTWQQQLADIGEQILDVQSLLTGGIGGWALQEALVGTKLKQYFEGDNKPKTWVDYATSAAQSTAGGIACFGASILVLRAIFGTSTKDGGMASLAGLTAIL